ncbi:MAG TPA: LptF/LptG family permease [Chitinophagaceae bacterium]|nr:LptF/LptG family permease [Chitinophagaceae bacterium]
MKKLDWYILKKFLVTFFFCIFLFTLIAVVVDISEKTDDFIKSGLGFKGIVMQYYIGFIPYIIALLFPLFVLIAVVFFTSKMAGRSEIVAILASGTSFRRFLVPYFMGGTLLGLILLYGAHYVIPEANGIRGSFETRYVNGGSSYNAILFKDNDIYERLDSFTYFGIRNYDTARKHGGPFFLHRIKGTTQLVYNLRAESIMWDTTKHKNRWVLQGVFERTINGPKETITTATKKEMPEFNFKPFDLSHDEFAKDRLTTPDLSRFIKLEELRGAEDVNTLKVERYRRTATPITVLILTLIGATIASRKVRGGSGAHIAMAFIIGVIFILMDRFSTIFSSKGSLPPVIAAWIPNTIFIIVTWLLYRKAPK